MRKKAVFILFFVLCFLINPSLEYATTVSNAKDIFNEDLAEVEEFIMEQMDKGDIPGLSVTVVKDDKTIYEKGFGYADIESKIPVTPETLFELWSTSKAFTFLGVLNLEKNGVINLNDPITKYIPWLKLNYKGQEATISIQDILYHTSGIPFKTISQIPVSNNDDKAIENTVRTLVGIELDSVPGTSLNTRLLITIY